MTTSYLSPDEVDALQSSGLHRDTPYAIRGVSMSQFSVSRYSGGCKYNGHHYVYQPTTDELIRLDVIKWAENRRRAARKVARDTASQPELPGVTPPDAPPLPPPARPASGHSGT